MNDLAVWESLGARRKPHEPGVLIVAGPQCSLQLSLKLLIGRHQIQIRMRITEELDFNESPPRRRRGSGKPNRIWQAPKRGAISRRVAVGKAPRTQVGECVLDLSSEVPMW